MKKLLLLILFSTYLVAGCSNDLIGKFTINEVFKPGDSIVNMDKGFIEISDTDTGDDIGFDDTWKVRVKSNDSETDYDLDVCDGDEYASFEVDDNDEIDLENGMSISLVDGDGNYIDYLVLQSNDVEGNLDECDYDYETEISFTNDTSKDRDIYRDPDKTGDWIYEEKSSSFLGGGGSDCTENSTVSTVYVNDDADSYDADNDDADCDDANFDNIPDALQKIRDNDSGDKPFKVLVCDGSYDVGSTVLDFNTTNFDGFTLQGETNKFVEVNSTADILMNINHEDIEKITITGFRLNHNVSCDSTCDNSKSMFGFSKNKNNSDSKINISNMGFLKSGCQSLGFNSNAGGAFKFSGFGEMESGCTPFKIEDCSSDDSFSFKNIMFKLTSDLDDQFGLYFSDDVDKDCDIEIKGVSLDMAKSAGIRFYELDDFEFKNFAFKNSGDSDSVHAFYSKKLVGTNYTFKYFDINASGRAFEFGSIDSGTDFKLEGKDDYHSVMRSRNSHGLKLPDQITNATIVNTDIYPNSDYAIYLTLSGDFNLTNSIIKSKSGVFLEDDADVQKVTVNGASITTTDDDSTGALHFKGKIKNGLNISNTYINSDYTGIYLNNEITGDLNITDTNITATSDDEARGLYTKEAINDNINFKNLYIKSSKDCLRADKKIDGDVYLDELNITSTDYYALCFKENLKSLTIENSDINASTRQAVLTYKNVNGNYKVINTKIFSEKESIYAKGDIDGDVIIKDSDFNSTNYVSLYLYEDVNGDFNLTNSSVHGDEYGIYIKKDFIINIKDSNITSRTKYPMVSNSDEKLNISGSCLMSTEYEYALQIVTDNTDIDNNCFKSTDTNKLVNSDASKNKTTFTHNSWYEWTGGDYENDDIKDSGTQRCSIGCYPDDEEDVNFTVCDSFRNDDGKLNDLNISTKIIKTSFDLNISAVDADNNITDFNGTVCYQIQDDNNESVWESDEMNRSIIVTYSGNDVTFISKDAWMFIKWKKDTNKEDVNCSESLDGNVTSTDHFAIRPKEFFINLSDSTVKAGSDFNLTFLAGYDKNSPSHDYNETNEGSDASFSVTVKEQNQNAIDGVFDPDITSNVDFEDGKKDFTNITYNEVGIVDINISENNTSCSKKYASIDCDDKNITDYWNTDTDIAIVEKVETLTITPHHFNVTVESANFEVGLFTYVAESNLTLMSAIVDINVTAQNENNETTKNYNKDCYANDVKMDYNYSSVDEDLNQFLYFYEFSDKNSSEGNVSVNDRIYDDINKTSFSTDNNGSALFKIKYNFKRDRSTPISPFDVEVPDFNAVDSNSSDVNGSGQDISNANFCWGRTKTDDISTSEKKINHLIKIEVYDDAKTSYTRTFTQNSLKWYQHENHNRVIDGNISDIYPTTTSTLKNVDTDIDITIKSPNNGDVNITIDNTSENEDTYYMHEKIRPWLWYTVDGYGDDYNDSDGSSCSAHPCFKYTFDKDDNSSENTISSGDYNGGDTQTKSTGENTRVGIKVYR